MTCTELSFNGVFSDSQVVDIVSCRRCLFKTAKMSHSTKSLDDESLMDSWVDLNVSGELSRGSDGSQKRLTPISSLINSGKLEKLLWEAQRESCQSSQIGSGISSRRGSPKSPRTPLNEDHTLEELIPSQHFGQRRHGSTDWIWDWSSKPDQRPPKEWKLQHPKPTLSLRNSKIAKSSLFSPEILTILVVSHLVTLMIGTGFGIYYITKRIGPQFSLQ